MSRFLKELKIRLTVPRAAQSDYRRRVFGDEQPEFSQQTQPAPEMGMVVYQTPEPEPEQDWIEGEFESVYDTKPHRPVRRQRGGRQSPEQIARFQQYQLEQALYQKQIQEQEAELMRQLLNPLYAPEDIARLQKRLSLAVGYLKRFNTRMHPDMLKVALLNMLGLFSTNPNHSQSAEIFYKTLVHFLDASELSRIDFTLQSGSAVATYSVDIEGLKQELFSLHLQTFDGKQPADQVKLQYIEIVKGYFDPLFS